jgi:hypothetical protein
VHVRVGGRRGGKGARRRGRVLPDGWGESGWQGEEEGGKEGRRKGGREGGRKKVRNGEKRAERMASTEERDGGEGLPGH